MTYKQMPDSPKPGQQPAQNPDRSKEPLQSPDRGKEPPIAAPKPDATQPTRQQEEQEQADKK